MKLDKFTTKTSDALESAQNIALEFHHQELNPFHILSALLTQEDSIIPQILSKIGVNTQDFQTRINEKTEKLQNLEKDWQNAYFDRYSWYGRCVWSYGL